MLVRSFLKWYRQASVPERIEAVSTFAAAYLAGQLGGSALDEAEAALTLVLDDSAPAVRRALAWALAPSEAAPRAIIVSLAHDEAQVSGLVLARSPLLRDADLVDCVRTGDRLAHLAIAMRPVVSLPVSTALVEFAGAEALVALVNNPGADLAPGGFARMIARHPSAGALRHALSQREDLPATVRQSLVTSLSADLLRFVETTGWLEPGRAQRIIGDTTEMATITLAQRAADPGVFVEHLRGGEGLTPSLLLRSLLCGDAALFGAALARLTGFSPARVAGILKGRGGAPLLALCDKADLPRSLFPAFEAALRALKARSGADVPGPARLDRAIIGAVLTACLPHDEGAMRPVIAMLRRMDAEAAREEARLIADALLATDEIAVVEADAAEMIDLDAFAAELDDVAMVETTDGGNAADDACGIDAGAAAQHDVAEPVLPAAPVPDAEEWSPPVARILHRLKATPLPAPITAPVMVEPMVATPAPAPLVTQNTELVRSYHEELDDLFAVAFGYDAPEQTPSHSALRVIERPEDGLDEAFFANWTLRRDAA